MVTHANNGNFICTFHKKVSKLVSLKTVELEIWNIHHRPPPPPLPVTACFLNLHTQSKNHKMEVEIISSESIKPSSPTPKHLKTHKLSLLDQFIPSIYIPMVLFYTFDDDKTKADINDAISQRLLL